MNVESIMKALKNIIALDKTPRYEYSKGSRNYKNANGEAPPPGQRWATPRELAEDLLKTLQKEREAK